MSQPTFRLERMRNVLVKPTLDSGTRGSLVLRKKSLAVYVLLETTLKSPTPVLNRYETSKSKPSTLRKPALRLPNEAKLMWPSVGSRVKGVGEHRLAMPWM